MSKSASHIEWDDEPEDDNDTLTTSSNDNLSRKQRLEVRRKLEDRMEMKRLREEIGDLEELWLD